MTTGSTLASRGLLAGGVEAMSLISVSLALLSTNDSASGSRGFKLGSRGTAEVIEGPQPAADPGGGGSSPPNFLISSLITVAKA